MANKQNQMNINGRGTCSVPISWGDQMPAEENQHNFTAADAGYVFYSHEYVRYFNMVFQAYADEYKIIHESFEYMKNISTWDGAVFWFMKGDKPTLCIEIKHERSKSDRLRKDCERLGIPYLRFYHNHEGWWNTRAYVLHRVNKALAR